MNKPIWKLSAFNSAVKMLIMSVSFFWAIYYKSIGFSGAEIGIIFGLATITGLTTVLPSGFINDKFKSKDLITIAILLLAAQFIGISQFHSFPSVLFFAILGGIGQNLYTTSADSLFYKSTEKKNVTHKIAIYQSLNYFALGLGMILSGSILDLNIPFEQLILGIGGGFIVLSLIARTLQSNITADFNFLNYKADLLRPKVLFFMFIVFLFAIHFGAEATSYGLFLEDTLGLSKKLVGLYMGLAIFLMGIWSIIFSKSLKFIKVKSLLFTGLILSSLGHVLMTHRDPIYSFIFRAFHEAGDAAMFVFFAYGITKMFDIKRLGGNTGIFTFTTILGATIGSLMFGPMGEKFGYQVPLIVTGGILALGFVLALIFNKLILVKR
ncbi:MFS transporter [Candidatus Peregrinibacteria bacterium]|jgi:MFS family permease|nr:MFS transporter [Candidatus Peregrinibacteria bacterium]MBT4148159.1 MFS transporter [Candidatus Peregrinibacteria bacterium]MBT4366646.1 MFS transporter [Candidatus Peregrinibacteria bacterium]MBT4455633.1 MFS transporter [Candidatus Peregrinibacteria bacterium]